MSATDDEWMVTGFDPDEVSGYSEDAEPVDADLEDAVPRVMEGVPWTGDLEKDAHLELDAVAQGFRARKEAEAERFALATESDYWVCVCFATKDQRDAWLDAEAIRDLGHRYIDGRLLAKRQGHDLPPDPAWPNQSRTKTWDEYAMTVDENRALEGGNTP